MNNFNFLAPIYDHLARFVFGQTLYEASIHFLDNVPPKSKVLILGGGTGKILPHFKDYQVVYLEKSSKMLGRASKRPGIGTVQFIHADCLEWEPNQQFDAVICPFFLDVFTPENLRLVLNKIETLTTKGGTLIVTDFQDSDLFKHKLLLRFMHLFFRVFSMLESRRLGAIEDQVLRGGYKLKSRKTFCTELIFSGIYQRK